MQTARDQVPRDITDLHDWLAARDYTYYSVNSLPSCSAVDTLCGRWPVLGVAWRQLFRLSPLDFRSLLGCHPHAINPKATVLLAKAYLRLWQQYGDARFLDAFRVNVSRLGELRAPALKHFAIRQNKKVYTRLYRAAEDGVSPLCTARAGHLFLDAWTALHRQEYLEAATEIAEYFVREHPRDEGEDGIYFYYEPTLPFRVYNASAVISAFLVRAGVMLEHSTMRELGAGGIDFICSKQNADGWWFNGEGRHSHHVDGFHTAYILEALLDISTCTESKTIRSSLKKGMAFYRSHLFEEPSTDSIKPRRYVSGFRPTNSSLFQRVDLRDCAMAVVLFSKHSHIDPENLSFMAKVLNWTQEHMRKGRIYCSEITWLWRNPIPYIEFQAWMLLALAEYYHTVRDRT